MTSANDNTDHTGQRENTDDGHESPAADATPDEETTRRPKLTATRRRVLATAGIFGLLSHGAGTASADPSGQIGTSSDPLQALYTADLHGSSGTLTLQDALDQNGNDIEDGGTTIWDAANGYVPQSQLENDSVTVAGNSVSLGGSTGVSHGDLSNVGSSDHHTRPSAGNALADNSNTFDVESGGIGTTELATPFADLATLFGSPVTAGGDVDLAGNNLETSTGGLTVTTNDNGNLTLDPGSNNELQLSNQSTSSSGSLLAVDGSGNVLEASSTTLSDVGGSPSSLATSGNSVTAVDVIDGTTSVSASSDTSSPPNVIGGHPSNNTAGSSVKGATIGGGGGDSGNSNDNAVNADWATVGGGNNNTASGTEATVGGGTGNTASVLY